jgi:hypothetical protein
VWALAGFYLSLVPSLALQLLHSKNLLWGGVLIVLLTGLGAAASAAVARKSLAGVMLGGCVTLIVGAMVTFAPIETGAPAALFVGTAVAGLGFGSAFVGRTDATSHFGLHKTAHVYSVAVALLATAAVSLLIRQMAGGRPRRVTDHPDVPPRGSGSPSYS